MNNLRYQSLKTSGLIQYALMFFSYLLTKFDINAKIGLAKYFNIFMRKIKCAFLSSDKNAGSLLHILFYAYVEVFGDSWSIAFFAYSSAVRFFCFYTIKGTQQIDFNLK